MIPPRPRSFEWWCEVGFAQANGVVVPEGLRVDQRAGHPGLIRRQRERLEGEFGNT